MEPATGYIAASALAAGGSLLASKMGSNSAKRQMRFQRNMSNTAHQREMADLKKAGLNPLLTGKYGGSSTPTGTSFTPENPVKDVPQITSAYNQQKIQKQLVTQQTAKLAAETRAINMEVNRKENLFPLQMDQVISTTNQSDTTSALNQKNTERLFHEIKKLKLTRKFYEFLDGATPSPENMKQFLKTKSSSTYRSSLGKIPRVKRNTKGEIINQYTGKPYRKP